MTATSTQIRPMLAAQKYRNPGDLWKDDHLKVVEQHLKTDGHLIAQPKVDGMRFLAHDGVARSRSWKPLANTALQAWVKEMGTLAQGMDGEVFPGHQYDQHVFRKAMSDIRAADGSREFTVILFDNFLMQGFNYATRRESASVFCDWHGTRVGNGWHAKTIMVPQAKILAIDQLFEYAAKNLEDGWEGTIVRRWPLGYKYNRSTASEGYLVKMTTWEDDEAIVIGYEPAYANQNEATTSALGFTARSAHQENLVPKDYLGSLQLRLLSNPDVEFSLGVFKGLSEDDKRELLKLGDGLLNRIVKFRHKGHGGGYDKPRTPVFDSFRNPSEL